MRLIENVGILLLSIWLILDGAVELFTRVSGPIQRVTWLVSLLAGIFLFFRLQDRLAEVNVGLLLLGIWLAFSGGLPLLELGFIGSEVFLSLCAVIAGIFLIPSARLRTFYYLGLSFLGVWLVGSQAVVYYGISQPWPSFLALLALLASLFLLLGL